MNDIFLNNPLFLTFSMFLFLFPTLERDTNILNNFYPNKIDYKKYKIKQIEILETEKFGLPLSDSLIFKFTKNGEMEYCGSKESNNQSNRTYTLKFNSHFDT